MYVLNQNEINFVFGARSFGDYDDYELEKKGLDTYGRPLPKRKETISSPTGSNKNDKDDKSSTSLSLKDDPCSWSNFGKSIIEGTINGAITGGISGSIAPGIGSSLGAGVGALGGAISGGAIHLATCWW